ncbi:MAG: 50S ribosomal protein L9 [Bacteroidota bacterium]|nr:50S ribosomal protein L9 [Bacteroidota bacterium]
MKVILKKDYELVGDEGQIVEVKNGYARNYLIPNGIAINANEGNLRNFEEIKKQRGRKVQKQLEETHKLASDLASHVVTIEVKAGEEDKIFGSVTAQMIHDNLVENGFDVIDRKKIILKEPIKTLGEHELEIKLPQSVVAKLRVNVVKISSDIKPPAEDVKADEESVPNES